MRKIVAHLFMSLDGVIESPDQWQFDHFDEDMMEELNAQIAIQDAMLLGRVIYEEWASYWPTSTDEPFASYINSIPKYVVSNTLEHVDWGGLGNITLLKGDIAQELAKLKQQPGQNIGVSGSPGLTRFLLTNNLLDELRLAVHPVIVGSGMKRLFDEDGDLMRLKLVSSSTTRTGVALMAFQPYKES